MTAPHGLLGRDPAMQTLRGALGRAREAHGVVSLVSGEAGIGKSTLASAIATEASASGAQVVWGRAWEFADAPPYFPLRAPLRALGLDPHAVRYAGDAGAFTLWEDALEALARTPAPVVWVVEDLHAADLQTLDLLTYLAQAARGLRLLVVATMRPGDPRLTPRAEQRVARIAREGLDLALGPLDSEDVARLAQAVVGDDLPARTLATIAEITAGNPLFVVECARSLQRSGNVRSLPPTVSQLVGARVEALSETTQEALACAAVLGREASAAEVGAMLDVLPARAIDALTPALRAGLLQELAPGRFRFVHVIVRDVVESRLPAAARATLHTQAARALETTGDGSHVALVERARHGLEAAALGAPALDVDVVRRAIERLRAEGGFDRAWALAERLLGARLHVLSDDEVLAFAELARGAGRFAETTRLCEQVLASARTRGDAVTFAHGVLALGAEIRPGISDPTLIARLEEARALLGDAAPAVGCRLDARLAAALQPHDDIELPIRMARAAFERARGLGDDVYLEVLDVGVAALVDFAPVAERLRVFEELRERSGAARNLRVLLRAHLRLALDHVFVGDFDAFSRSVDDALRVASELGHPRFRWRPLLLASMRALANGDVAESERHVVEAKELAAVTDDANLAMSLLGHEWHRAMVLHDRPALVAVEKALARFFANVPGTTAVAGHAYRASVFARLDDAEGTRRELSALGSAIRYFEREVGGAAMMVEALVLAGDEAHRRRVHAFLATHEDRECCGGHIIMSYEGPVGRAVALLDASLGDVPSAVERLERARTRAEERGHRTWMAQLDLDLARTLRDAGQHGAALARAAAAARLATDLGIEGLATSARALGDLPLAPPPVAPPRAMAMENAGDGWRITWGGRELRVAASRGLTLLARLVARPDEEMHVLALASDEGTAAPESSAGEALDERARLAYRDRLRAIACELADAEAQGDLGAATRLHAEQDMLEAEIARAFGLGGRPRKDASATERARVNVQRRLKDALGRIADQDAELGRHLQRAVRTGTFCCYRP